MEKINLNLIPEHETPVFHVSQGDNDRTVRCELFDGFQTYTLTGAENIKLRFIRSDGGVGSIDVVNTSNDYVDIETPASLTDAVGLVYCKLRIDNIGAKAFYIQVERRP